MHKKNLTLHSEGTLLTDLPTKQFSSPFQEVFYASNHLIEMKKENHTDYTEHD